MNQYELLLLRKIEVDPNLSWQVSKTCLSMLRKCFPSLKEDDDETLTTLALDHVREAIREGWTFENPKRKTQWIAHAEVEGRGCWFVLAPGGDKKAPVVVTVRIHKERDYGEELAVVEGDEDGDEDS